MDLVKQIWGWAAILNPSVLLLCGLPILFLERFLPAKPNQNIFSRHLAFDYAYSTFVVALNMAIGASTIIAIKRFLHLPITSAATTAIAQSPTILQFVLAYLISDFAGYVSHVARHKISWFWYFHQIHHSQTSLNMMTTDRNHPVDRFVISAILQAIPLTILGFKPEVLASIVMLQIFLSMAVHANIRTNLGWLGFLFVSPQSHRIHHSVERQHWNKNYGLRLNVWDLLFRTFSSDRTSYPETGAPGTESILEAEGAPRAALRQHLHPFQMIWRDIKAAERLFEANSRQ